MFTLLEALPIWARQIETSRTQTEDAVVSLSERFSGIVQRLDAALEAAHAGERGKGFAVAAQEVRALSNAARDTGKRITQRVTQISEALGKIGETNETVTQRDQREVKNSEAHIGAVLNRFMQSSSQFAERAQRSTQQGGAIKAEVEESMVQLQFQDRVSQILAQVVTSIARMTEWARSDHAAPQAAQGEQLDHMLGSYATGEQRRSHQGLAVAAVAPQAVTFF